MGVPVLWVVGPPGVGKSTTGWRLVQRLAADHVVGYLDIDQLGMLYPPPAGDPDRWALKASALAAVRPAYATAGAELLVVSGVTDLVHGPRVPGCRRVGLFLDEGVLIERVRDRGWSPEDERRVVAEQRALAGAAFLDAEIDTTGRSVEEVVDELARRVPTSAPDGGAGVPAAVPTTAVVLVTGARAVGSSRVGWELRQRLAADGARTGFADLDQLAVLRPEPGPADPDALALDVVRRLVGTFARRGAERLVLVGRLEPGALAELGRAVAPGSLRVVRLRAQPATVAARIGSRHGGGAARLLPDDLLAASRDEQRRIGELSAAQQAADDEAGVGDLVLGVDGSTPAEVAGQLHRWWAQR